ncbi:MAG: DUF115 domain-containing protein [Desulfobacteraceae bacterium]|nr:DUF115 domain-containing protein [Desulfobacteraceae bacterium]
MHPELTDFFTTNLELLKKHHPKVWEQMTENPPEPLGSISYAPNGSPNLTVTNSQGTAVTLHDETTPDMEAAVFLKKIRENHTGFAAILGMGLGYATLDILKNRPNLQYLAIFELEPGIFFQALKHMDLSPILTEPRILLRIGSEVPIHEAIATAHRTLQLEDAEVFHHSPSFQFNPTGYHQLKDDLYSHLNTLNVGGATTRAYGKDFFNNRFKHITTIHHHLLLEQMQDKFAGVPAILVAGGPSLDKNIHLLPQIQEKAVIIAVDTVLPTLLKHGVHPHFLTSIDPSNLTYEKFADVIPKAKDIALICSSWVNPLTPKAFPADQTFWTFTKTPVEAWVNSLLEGKISTGGSSTVAHLNLISADMLGCDPIIFMGQDLAYSGSATHATDAVLHGSAPTKRIKGNEEGTTVMGTDGKILRTNRSFLSMKKHFEAAIASSGKTHINATEGGAHIEGTEILALQEVIDTHCTAQVDTTRRLKKYYTDIKPPSSQKLLVEFNSIHSKTMKLNRVIEKADKLSSSLLKKVAKLQNSGPGIKSFSMLPRQIQQQIHTVDHLHGTLDNALDVWTIVEEITMEGLKQSERQRQEIATLQNDPNNYSLWLTKNLNRLIDINKIRKETLSLLAGNLKMVTSFHKEESTLLKKIEKNLLKKENNLELVRLYMGSKDYYLAKQVVERLREAIPKSGEVFFHLGCIAAQFADHEKAAEYFRISEELDSRFTSEITDYLHGLADELMSFAAYFNIVPGYQASEKHMLLKGLRYCPTHKKLSIGLKNICKKELKEIKSALNANNYQKAAPLINEWYQTIIKPDHSTSSLPAELMGEIFLNHGKLQLADNNFPEALASLKKAMSHSPLDHDIHSITIETLFAKGDFDEGIEMLNKAISMDNNFAFYWETIGDSLQADGQKEDAILAYERCFIHLPDNIHILKKMGDCYMATNQLEAAKAAYQQLKTELEKGNSARPNL